VLSSVAPHALVALPNSVNVMWPPRDEEATSVNATYSLLPSTQSSIYMKILPSDVT
jgi:hypothetical protein